MKSKLITRILIVLLIIGAIVVANYYDIQQYLTLSYVKEQQNNFVSFYERNPVSTIGIFMLVYILVAALSIPGVTILTVLAGSLFGLLQGTIVVSFASTIGATLAFLVCRFLLRDFVEKKFPRVLRKVNEGIAKEGNRYLFALRLVPAFPFFVVNAVVSLTRMKTIPFYWISQIGMLPGTIVYVNVGKELANIESLGDIFSLRLLLAFVLLAFFPFLVRALMEKSRTAKIYSRFRKPKKFDYNLVVIGGGSAGLVASYIAATVKAKVALVEKHKMGGDCLNTGCVPSKALIRSAKVVHEIEKASEFGISKVSYKVDFAKVMANVKNVIKKIAPHDSIERYTDLGVECITDEAVIRSPWQVQLKKADRIITTRNIIIATGASPMVFKFPGLEKINYLTSDNVWNLKKLPKNLLVLGGGPIGCELSQSFQRLGSAVTLLEMDRLMRIEDPEVSQFVKEKLTKEGVKVLDNHVAKEFNVSRQKKYLNAEYDGKIKKITFDEVIIALGRRANMEGFGLDNLRVNLRKNNTIEANEFLETNYPNIFVCGDVTGPYQLTHVAAHQAWYASVNALFGKFKKFKVDYRVIPWCTYTDPEVATVGINEATAKRENIEYDLTTYGIDDLDRAIADHNDEGFIRVLTEKGKDRILGATVVGAQASLLIMEFVAGMKHGFGLNKILSTIHVYPSLGEANKYVAGNWAKMRIKPKLMEVLSKFHAWMRN